MIEDKSEHLDKITAELQEECGVEFPVKWKLRTDQMVYELRIPGVTSIAVDRVEIEKGVAKEAIRVRLYDAFSNAAVGYLKMAEALEKDDD